MSQNHPYILQWTIRYRNAGRHPSLADIYTACIGWPYVQCHKWVLTSISFIMGTTAKQGDRAWLYTDFSIGWGLDFFQELVYRGNLADLCVGALPSRWRQCMVCIYDRNQRLGWEFLHCNIFRSKTLPVTIGIWRPGPLVSKNMQITCDLWSDCDKHYRVITVRCNPNRIFRLRLGLFA